MAVPGAVPASLPKRLLATVVDGVAALVLGGAFVLAGAAPLLGLGGAGDPAALTSASLAMLLVGGVALLALGLVQWWMLGTRGVTLGKRLVGLRALSADDARPVGLGRAFIRLAVPAASSVVPVVGPAAVLLSPLADGSGRRRGWHDLAAGTVVYDVALGVDPTTAPRPSREEVARRLEQVVGPRAVDVVDGTVGQTPPVAAVPSSLVPAAPNGGEPTDGVPTDGVPMGGELPAPHPPAAPDVIRAVPGAAQQASPHDALQPVAQPPVAQPPGTDPDTQNPDTTRPIATSRVVPRSAQVLTAVPFPGRREDEDVEMTRLRPARGRVPELAPVETQATVALSDGQRVTFTGTALVGRNPAPRAGETVACLISVADPGRSVSKTHMAIGVDRHGVWVRDRASTNGTVVTLPDGQQILCGAEQQVRLPRGASVAFGDYGLDVAELTVVGQEA